jgi:hypothetical protein
VNATQHAGEVAGKSGPPPLREHASGARSPREDP